MVELSDAVANSVKSWKERLRLSSIKNCVCLSRFKTDVDVEEEEEDYFDLEDAYRDEDRLKDDWQWLSIRCERRLNERLNSFGCAKANSSINFEPATVPPNEFACFVPNIIRSYILKNDSEKKSNSIIKKGHAAVVFCDVSGFTALAEAIENSGDLEAAATLGKCLNNFFDPLINIINHWGGDIMKFSGDAVLVVWIEDEANERSGDGSSRPTDSPHLAAVPVDYYRELGNSDDLRIISSQGEVKRELTDYNVCHPPAKKTQSTDNLAEETGDELHILENDTLSPSDRSPRVMAMRALKCCEELHAVLGNFPTGIEDRMLAMHIGVSFGEISIFHVGGIMDYWEFVISGPPLGDIAVAEPLAKSGETVISRSILDMSAGRVEAEEIQEGYYLLKRVDYEFDGCVGDRLRVNMDTQHVPIVKDYISDYIYSRLLSGYNVFNNEMRKLSTIFVSVYDFDISSENGKLVAQQIMVICQKAAYAVEGVVNKFLVDDKGIVLLIFMGFPPFYHIDDPVRSVFVAFKIVSSCERLGLNVGIGISTGKVWCGTLGNSIRKEYTALGDYVNLSARLMSESVRTGDYKIYVDEDTFNISKESLEFQKLRTIKLKGKNKLVDVYTPTGKVIKLTIDDYNSPNSNPLQTWKQWNVYKLINAIFSRKKSKFLNTGGVMMVTGYESYGIVEVQSLINELMKNSDFTTFSLSTINDESISITSDSGNAWKTLCNGLVDKWHSSEHRRKIFTLNHSKNLYNSEHFVSKKAVNELVKELLDPSLHWSMSTMKHLVNGLDAQSMMNSIKNTLNFDQLERRNGVSPVDGRSLYFLADSGDQFREDDDTCASEDIPSQPSEGKSPSMCDVRSLRNGAEITDVDMTLLEKLMLDKPIAPFISSMVEGYSMYESVCIILNLRRGTSVQSTIDEVSWTIILKLAQLAMSRRDKLRGDQNRNLKPIVFIIITTPHTCFLKSHSDLLEMATACNAVVNLNKLNWEQTKDLIAHCLRVTNSTEVPDELTEYIYTNTSGMARFVYKSILKLERDKMVTVEEMEVERHGDDKSPCVSENSPLHHIPEEGDISEVRRKEVPGGDDVPGGEGRIRGYRLNSYVRNTGFMRRSQVLRLMDLVSSDYSSIRALVDIIKSRENVKISANIENATLIDEIRSFAMSTLDSLQPDELFIAKVASLLPEPFTVEQLFGSNPKGFNDDQFELIIKSLIANGIIEPIDDPTHSYHNLYGIPFKLFNYAIKLVIAERILNDEKKWIIDNYKV